MINSIVTGCLTAIGSWVLVGVVYKALKGRSLSSFSRQQSSQYDPLYDAEKGGSTATCSSRLLLILSGVAIGGACLCSWASTQLLNAILRSTSCFDLDEVLVAILAAMLAAAVAIVCALQFLGRAYPNQPHPLLGTKAEPPKQSKLLLVEVPEGSTFGHNLSPDIMASGGSYTSQMQSQMQSGVQNSSQGFDSKR